MEAEEVKGKYEKCKKGKETRKNMNTKCVCVCMPASFA